MIKYRISKYDPSFRNEKGYYMKKEWGSFSDIGKVYNGQIFLRDEYIRVEQKYIRVVLYILAQENVKTMIIQSYEKGISKKRMRQYLWETGLNLTREDIRFLKKIHNNKIIMFSDLKRVIKLLLREVFWCILKDPETGCMIEIGYDYYVYVTCHPLEQDFVNKVKKQGIYIETVKNKV